MIGLVGIIAVAGGIGIVISLGQRSRPALIGPAATPTFAPRSITPSPVPSAPQAGLGFSLADDRATREIVLFGGVGDYTSTWLWNGARWSLAHPQNSPAGRYGASAAYDPQTRTVMLSGGGLNPAFPSTTRGRGTGPRGARSTVGRAARRPARDRTWPGIPRSIRWSC